MKPPSIVVVVLVSAMGLAACGKSSEQMEREQAARQAAMQKALATNGYLQAAPTGQAAHLIVVFNFGSFDRFSTALEEGEIIGM